MNYTGVPGIRAAKEGLAAPAVWARPGYGLCVFALGLLGGSSSCHGAARVATEEAYLVSEVGRTIGRWTSRPGLPSLEREASPIDAPRYAVAVAGSRTSITLGKSIWDPTAYVPLVALGAQSQGRVPSCDQQPWIQGLLSPTPSNLVALDKDISERLRSTPTDPCLHEIAALLTGTFLIREYPGYFYDPRASLSRMTGHLALARAFGSDGTSLASRLAEGLLLSMSWNQAEVPARIVSLSADPSPTVQHWAHALSLLSLQDFRQAENMSDPSRLELLAGGLALAMKSEPKTVLNYLEANGDESSDWARIGFSRSSAVEVCNAFADSAPAAVMAEASLVLGAPSAASLFEPDLVTRMNDESEEKEPRVLGRAAWAAFEQRALVTVLSAQYRCYKQMYGLPEEAAKLRSAFKEEFGHLRLAPLLFNQIANDKPESEPAIKAAAKLARTRPDLVTWINWAYIPWDGHLGPRPATLPEERSWFNPLLPRGTAFDYNRRFYSRRGNVKDLALLEAAHTHVQHALATRLWAKVKYGDKVDAKTLRGAFGAVAAFDRDALLAIAEAAKDTDPSEHRRAYEELCALIPRDCDLLAGALRDAGEEEKAALTFEEWAATGEAVSVANTLEWTVEYFRTHGEKKRAERLAIQAASTGAGRGLATYGNFLERIGRTEAAFERFSRISERYDNPSNLLAFINRHEDVPRYVKIREGIVATTFPQGLRRVTIADMASETASGADVITPPRQKEFAGLQSGDIIGATDGIRVSTLKEFRVARALNDAKEATLIVWRHGSLTAVRLPRAALAEASYRD